MAALTLQQLTNSVRGRGLNDTCSLVELIDGACKKWAGKLKEGTTLKEQLPGYSNHSPTDAQINEWCNRVLDSESMSTRMRASVFTDAVFDSAGTNVTESQIENAVFYKIAAYSAKL